MQVVERLDWSNIRVSSFKLVGYSSQTPLVESTWSNTLLEFWCENLRKLVKFIFWGVLIMGEIRQNFYTFAV